MRECIAFHAFIELAVFCCHLKKFPFGQIAFLQHCGAHRSIDFNPFQISGENGSRTFNIAHGTIGKFQNSNNRVFHFNSLVPSVACKSLHRVNLSHVPLQEVNRMDALVHQSATTIQCDGSPPGIRFVIGLTAVPFYIGITQYDITKFCSIHGLLEQHGLVIKTGRKYNTHLHSCLPGCCDDAITFFKGDFQRLLYQAMLPRLDALERRILMGAGRSADANNVYGRIRQHLLQCIKCLAMVLCGKSLHFFNSPAVQSNQCCIADGPDGLGMYMRNHSSANDSKSKFSIAHPYLDLMIIPLFLSGPI